MRLSDYLDQNKISKEAFADSLGVSAEAVRLWCNGGRYPGAESMLAIRRATNGAVQPDDFLEQFSEKSNGTNG